MGDNKDLITPLLTKYTTSYSLPHCNDNESKKDELIITGSAGRESKQREKCMHSRWNPTPEQIMALEEVYRSGTRTPTTQQIQEIAANLQKYGRIEGKNVFYWFQNHKSRERLKRRRPDLQGFAINNVHEEPVRKDKVVAFDENKDSSSALRRRGDHRLIHTNTCFSSSSTLLQNNNIDEWKTEEYETRLLEEKEATCSYHLTTTTQRNQEAEYQYYLNEKEEEAIRKCRTLDLFPVSENQEKTDTTGFVEKNTKPNQLGCNYYYYYEFIACDELKSKPM